MATKLADLRVVMHDGVRHALYWTATLQGSDIYAGPPHVRRRKIFRISYHESGELRLYLLGRDPKLTASTPPASIIGKVRLGHWSHILNTVRWDYRPKKDSKKRKSLIIDVCKLEVPDSLTVELWAVELGRNELISEILEDDFSEARQRLGYLHADWTRPLLLVTVWTMAPKVRAALERSIKASKDAL